MLVQLHAGAGAAATASKAITMHGNPHKQTRSKACISSYMRPSPFPGITTCHLHQMVACRLITTETALPE
jgi:hypothetical protein